MTPCLRFVYTFKLPGTKSRGVSHFPCSEQEVAKGQDDHARDAEKAGDQDVDEIHLEMGPDKVTEKAHHSEQQIAESRVDEEFQNALDGLEQDLDEQHDEHDGGGGHQNAGYSFHEKTSCRKEIGRAHV